MEKVSLQDELARIPDHWNPRVVGELNGQHVKLVKFQGEFHWHAHAQEDELFLVVRGSFRMDLPQHSITLQPGEFLIVPRGTPHRPVAPAEVEVLLFEPSAIQRTGHVPILRKPSTLSS